MARPAGPLESFARFQLPALIDSSMLAGWLAGWLVGWLAGWLADDNGWLLIVGRKIGTTMLPQHTGCSERSADGISHREENRHMDQQKNARRISGHTVVTAWMPTSEGQRSGDQPNYPHCCGTSVWISLLSKVCMTTLI